MRPSVSRDAVASTIPGNAPQPLWSWAEMLTLLGLKNILWQGGGGYDYSNPVTLPYTPPLPPIDFDFSDTPMWLAAAGMGQPAQAATG